MPGPSWATVSPFKRYVLPFAAAQWETVSPFKRYTLPFATAQWATASPFKKVTTAFGYSSMGKLSAFKRYTKPFAKAWWAACGCELCVLGSPWSCLDAATLVLLHMTAFAFLALPFVALLTHINILMATAHIANSQLLHSRLAILVPGTPRSNCDQRFPFTVCRPSLSLHDIQTAPCLKLTASIVFGDL